MRKLPRIALVALVVVVIAAVAAVAWMYSFPPTPPAKKVLVFAYPTDFPDLDPSVAFENEHVILSNVYEALVYYDAKSKDPLQPWLATSWTSSSDGLTWTFKLREGVKFHDDTRFTADAVKFSVERTKKLGLGAAFIWDPIKEITVVDEKTVQFKLAYPAPLPQIASSAYGAWIISPKVPSDPAAHDWFNKGLEGGTGPYVIERYERGAEVVLAKFNGYWKGWNLPHSEKVVIRTIRDPTVRLQAVKAGEADFTVELTREQLKILKDDRAVQLIPSPSFRNLVGPFNTMRSPTDNLQVRQALSYAFPYQKVIDAVWAGYASQSRGPIPKGMFGYSSDLPQYTYDLEKARDLLRKAGYPSGGFTITLTYTSGDLYEKMTAELYKAELTKLGIELDIREMTTRAKYALARGDPKQAQHILLFYWWPTFITPYDFMFNLFHSEEKVIFNFSYNDDPDLDKLIDGAYKLEGTNLQESLKMYRNAQEDVVNRALSLYIWDQEGVFVVSSKVHNFADNPAYTQVVFFYGIWSEQA